MVLRRGWQLVAIEPECSKWRLSLRAPPANKSDHRMAEFISNSAILPPISSRAVLTAASTSGPRYEKWQTLR